MKLIDFYILIAIILQYNYCIGDQVKIHEFDDDYYREPRLDVYDVVICTAACQYNNPKRPKTLNECYDLCSLEPRVMSNPIRLKPSAGNVKLLCRESTKISLKINRENDETDAIGHYYLIEIRENNENNYTGPSVNKKMLFLSNSSFVTIDMLKPEQKYQVVGTILTEVEQNKTDTTNPMLRVTTLPNDFTPGNITNIYIENFFLNSKTDKLSAVINWQPAFDRTCSYELFYHSRSPDISDDLQQIEINEPEQLYRYTIENIYFATEYAIGISSINSQRSPRAQSPIYWKLIQVPTCLEWFDNDVNNCIPEKPTNVIAKARNVGPNMYNIKISWDSPTIPPLRYSAEIVDAIGKVCGMKEISGNKTEIIMKNVEIHTIEYGLIFSAFSPKISTNEYFRLTLDEIFIEHAEKYQDLKLYVYIGIPLVVIFVIFIIGLVFQYRRTKIKRMKDRVEYFEGLEDKAPIEPAIVDEGYLLQMGFEAIQSESLYNFIGDKMEIEDEQIEIQEKIGEGAFGYVSRGILHPTKREVAVKMLKECPTLDEIKEFFKEIEVMKSVPVHSNIVGIIGHSTKCRTKLMLLTEYCDEGNLLDFLRNVWQHFNQDLNMKSFTPALKEEKLSENVFNFDVSFVNSKETLDHKDLSNEIIEQSTIEVPLKSPGAIFNTDSFVANRGYDECIANELPNMFKEQRKDFYKNNILMHADNYGYESEKSPSINVNPPRPKMNISYIDLLSFAKQIAEGMEFLAKNKVVHRDLAARNVLVCQDKTVKIADFGLSRDIYQQNLYRKCGQGKLPIKWLAIESMTRQIYTSQSDVWSYGILLYEIVTLGSTPYPSVDTSELLGLLKSGYRMAKPRNCDDEMYQLMMDCWKMVPSERPTFTDLKQTINGFIENFDNNLDSLV